MLTSAINRVRLRVRNDEAGFTLIELLVVVIIIGILAAIAIPTFLNQRKKGWESAVKSDLRNAAIVMETHVTETGSYLTPPTFAPSTDVEISLPGTGTINTADKYCIEAFHKKNTGDIWHLKPGASLAKGACT